MMLDLTSEQLETVKAILRENGAGKEFRAFGSRVDGTAKPFSDLDVAVVGEGPLEPEMRTALIDAFSESDLPFKVDIVDYSSTSEDFRATIDSRWTAIKA